MARRGTRPLSAGAGGQMGWPTTRVILAGRGSLVPLPMAASDPPMPTGTIGTWVRQAT